MARDTSLGFGRVRSVRRAGAQDDQTSRAHRYKSGNQASIHGRTSLRDDRHSVGRTVSLDENEVNVDSMFSRMLPWRLSSAYNLVMTKIMHRECAARTMSRLRSRFVDASLAFRTALRTIQSSSGTSAKTPAKRALTLGSIAIFGLMSATHGTAHAATIRPPQGGEIRALVIGIDAYQFVPPLRGAVADARDIESTLRSQGVRDVTALYDAAADRMTVMRTLDQLVQRSRSGDLVVLSIAGHGVQEPEHIKGSQPDGLDNVFVLAGFNPTTGAGTQQRIIGTEFNHVIKQFEAKGTYVLFVADACYGGGLAREIDPRAAEMSYRQAPRYSLTVDNLQPISTPRDAFLSDIDFERTAFLAAVDRNTKAPEIRIPGVPGFRGALSYAVARAFEGAADENRDDRVSQDELFTYVRQMTYQLSDQRQQVVTAGPISRDGSDAVFERTRGVVLLDAVRPGPPASAPPLGPVRIAVLGNQRDLLANLEAREVRFEVVGIKDNPDLIWDPASLDVLAGADVVARGIERADLASAIDRVAAVNGFKHLAAKGPQTVRILPDDKVHHRDARIDVQVSGIAQRSLLMFNIAGDGTVQALYPIGSDARVIAIPDYKFQVRVGEPFGADQVVAISSAQRLGDLEEVLRKMSQRRTAVEVFKLIARYAPPDARIGAVGIYTAP
jgi:caspase domain-containing protein